MIQPHHTLGLFCPLAQQVESAQQRWEKVGVQSVAIPLLPIADEMTIQTASQRMKTLQPDLILFDCVSYTPRILHFAQNHFQFPMVLASSIAINTLKLVTLIL